MARSSVHGRAPESYGRSSMKAARETVGRGAPCSGNKFPARGSPRRMRTRAKTVSSIPRSTDRSAGRRSRLRRLARPGTSPRRAGTCSHRLRRGLQRRRRTKDQRTGTGWQHRKADRMRSVGTARGICPAGYGVLAEHLADRVKEAGGDVRLGCEVFTVRWWPEKNCRFNAARRCARAAVRFSPCSRRSACRKCGRTAQRPAGAGAQGPLRGSAARHGPCCALHDGLPRPLVGGAGPKAKRPGTALHELRVHKRSHAARVVDTSPGDRIARPTLVGWSGGPSSEALQGKSAAELGAIACRELAAAFGMPHEEIRAPSSAHTPSTGGTIRCLRLVQLTWARRARWRLQR